MINHSRGIDAIILTMRFLLESRDLNELSNLFQKIFDGDDKIASVDALTSAGTNEQQEFMDVFDQDTYTRLKYVLYI